MPRPAPRLRQIDASQQQRQLLVTEDHLRFFARRCRPTEASLLQTFGAHPREVFIMPYFKMR
jgi:hypothetical protein